MTNTTMFDAVYVGNFKRFKVSFHQDRWIAEQCGKDGKPLLTEVGQTQEYVIDRLHDKYPEAFVAE